jgi:hypothetical protein
MKRDHIVSDCAFFNGIFHDPGSFFSLPDPRGRVHVHLEGIDRGLQRQRCLGKAKDKCAVCGHTRNHELLEMHHPGTCDCIDPTCPTHVEARCSQFVSDCHRHFAPSFVRKARTQ